MWQFSIPSGWQKGISSWVRFAPMTPATMAVSNIGPLLECSAAVAQRRRNGGGKQHFRFGYGGALDDGFAADIDHGRVPLGIEVCEGHGVQPPM